MCMYCAYIYLYSFHFAQVNRRLYTLICLSILWDTYTLHPVLCASRQRAALRWWLCTDRRPSRCGSLWSAAGYRHRRPELLLLLVLMFPGRKCPHHGNKRAERREFSMRNRQNEMCLSVGSFKTSVGEKLKKKIIKILVQLIINVSTIYRLIYEFI